jgi:UV DNA damage endonuclease
VLSSKNPNVIEKARKSLAHHAWVMDCMNLPQTPYYSINIHGGVKGESKTLIEQVKSLPNNIKNRLTFENDERAYNVQDLYQVYQETGIPICLDTHHASFNDSGIEVDKALDLAISTWGDCKPLTHLSNTEPELINGSFTDRRKHSQYVHYIPSYQQMLNDSGKIDIDFEFKMKQLAIFKAVEDFNIKL